MGNAQDGHGPGLSGWALKCILVKNEGGGVRKGRERPMQQVGVRRCWDEKQVWN